MDYSLKQEADILAVTVEASGIINTEVAEHMVIAAGMVINETHYKRCFFDLTRTEVDPMQTMTGMFLFVDVFKKAGFDKSVRIAVTYISGEEYRMHLEKAARMEGLNLRHFKSRGKALNWLCQ